MMNVPQRMRNEIAATGLMQHQALEKIFQMDNEDAADEELMSLARKQVKQNRKLVRPWICSAPLMLENVAISRFIAKNPDLRMLLPEVLRVSEAAKIAQVDYLLNEKMTRLLIESLKRPLLPAI